MNWKITDSGPVWELTTEELARWRRYLVCRSRRGCPDWDQSLEQRFGQQLDALRADEVQGLLPLGPRRAFYARDLASCGRRSSLLRPMLLARLRDLEMEAPTDARLDDASTR